jgi:hypothetical protein
VYFEVHDPTVVVWEIYGLGIQDRGEKEAAWKELASLWSISLHCIATDMLEVVDQPMQRKDDVLVT